MPSLTTDEGAHGTERERLLLAELQLQVGGFVSLRCIRFLRKEKLLRKFMKWGRTREPHDDMWDFLAQEPQGLSLVHRWSEYERQ